MKIFIVYDDTNKVSEAVAEIIGNKGFADVTVRKKTLKEYYREALSSVYPDAQWKVMRSSFDIYELQKDLDHIQDEEVKVLHLFSNFIIVDDRQVLLAYKKLLYIEEPYRVVNEMKIAALMFSDKTSYQHFLDEAGEKSTLEIARNIKLSFAIEGLVDIGFIHNFVQCITGNFDSRYFNTLSGNEYTLVKSSKNKEKIKSEYMFYQLLPEDLKVWYVMPFSYREDADMASYTMERLYMPDLATKWVYGSVDLAEFEEIMERYFYFFRCRHQKTVSRETYQRIANDLYINKVEKRVAELKRMEGYEKIWKALQLEGLEIDQIVEQYFRLKEKIEGRRQYPCISVIGHGDPCFSNVLYNRTTKTLKFIDPKGAFTEEELWTNPYYDIAKLSHSVCGRYDYFNHGLFQIILDEHFSFKVNIEFENTAYIEIFRRKAEENGYDYWTVRLYEASLFLSMLPLHMDYPYKVFGFLLNAKNILEEIERNA